VNQYTRCSAALLCLEANLSNYVDYSQHPARLKASHLVEEMDSGAEEKQAAKRPAATEHA
jgi:hypothetical protein